MGPSIMVSGPFFRPEDQGILPFILLDGLAKPLPYTNRLARLMIQPDMYGYILRYNGPR
jgi:hypothetical protein